MIASTPFSLIFVDHCGPLNLFKYILIAVDSCSRFLWVWPERSADTLTVIKDLQSLIAMGSVNILHNDNGPEFASEAFQETRNSIGVNCQYSNPFK
mgnify:CR=1 FL=1